MPVAAAAIVSGDPRPGSERPVRSPIDGKPIGTVREGNDAVAAAAMAAAHAGFAAWAAEPVETRAAALERAGDLLEARRGRLIGLLQAEGGKTLDDALAELREAVDFCRYYAAQARRALTARELPGPTGESNLLQKRGRGVFVCISPWNFPLAIFLGQVSAALVTGNAVVAKPAEQTPLIAAEAVRLLHQAGVPPSALHLVPGDGKVGAALIADPRVAGVAFTGSTEVARSINRALAAKDAPIVPFIAETGGINPMIVDATALPEQVTDDVVTSAFRSAGQRCSALRLLCVQEEVAEQVIEMIAGAARELELGDPREPSTHVGPVIDARSQGQARPLDRRHAGSGPRALPLGRVQADAGGGDLCAADDHQPRPRARPDARGVRTDPARRALACRAPRCAARRYRLHRLRPHPRSPFAHRHAESSISRAASPTAMSMSTAT